MVGEEGCRKGHVPPKPKGGSGGNPAPGPPGGWASMGLALDWPSAA